ncbi:kinase-like domain-containing protein [Thamnidium elegans]|nr:kinase-like domain-containing protein [Thamnidium elegans]
MEPQQVRQVQKKRKNIGWEKDYYKNGYPKEVIVISDSPTPPPPSSLSVDYATYNPKKRILHHPDQFQPDLKRQKWNNNNNANNIMNQSILAFHLFPSQIYNQQQQHISNKLPNKINHTYNNTITTTATTTAATTTNRTVSTTEVYDDKDGHYLVRPNESLTPQYKIMRLLGQGTFGKVVECFDRVRRTFCAIKIIRAIPKYRDASKIEIRVLNTLKQHDPLNLNKCIHLVEWFDHRNHICMVFELLGQSVFDFLKSNQFKPFPHSQIQQLAKQLFTSVAFLHDLKLVHTDLKPENILFVNPPDEQLLKSSDIRLIDFGSATFEKDYHSAVVSTRHYRAPEIILGLGWSYPCDIWSIGCILVEFFTGDALFQTHDNLEHLAMMDSVLGSVPVPMVLSANKEGQKFFYKESKKLKYPVAKTTRQSKKYVSALKPLAEMIPPTNEHNTYLIDLLKKLLVYEPSQRISARDALRHPFFHMIYDEDT